MSGEYHAFSQSPCASPPRRWPPSLLFGASGSAEPLAMNDPIGLPGLDLPASRCREPRAGRARGRHRRPTLPEQPAPPDRRLPTPRRQAPSSSIPRTPISIYVLGHGRAIRYGIGVGRDGFPWSGVQTVAQQAGMAGLVSAGGDDRAPALSAAHDGRRPRQSARRPRHVSRQHEYRIHGTNAPSTIGQRVSSGCIRLTNEDVDDLYNRVHARHQGRGAAGQRLSRASAPAPVTAAVSGRADGVSCDPTRQPLSIGIRGLLNVSGETSGRSHSGRPDTRLDGE